MSLKLQSSKLWAAEPKSFTSIRVHRPRSCSRAREKALLSTCRVRAYSHWDTCLVHSLVQLSPHLTPLLACRHTALTIQPSKASDCLSILNLLFCSRALFHAHIFFLKELLNEVSTSCILRFKWDRFWKLTCIFNLIQQGRRSCVGAVSDHTACAPPWPLTLRLSGHTVGE